MTVKELLEMPSLHKLTLLAGHLGIHKTVLSVTVIDTPDGTLWLRGNELVITTAYALEAESDALSRMIQDLHSRSACGLAVKVNRYLKEIPSSALDIANQLDFPLIACPEEFAFRDIINPVLSHIIDRQSALLRESDRIHGRFLDLAINNNSIPEILQALSEIIHMPTAFVDDYFKQCYFSDYNSDLARQLNLVSADAILPGILSHCDCHTVANKNACFGHILFPKPPTGSRCSNDFEERALRTALEYASIVLILRMQMRISNRYIEEKYQTSFTEDLLYNNIKTEAEIHNRAQLYGWDLRNGGFVFIVDINNIKKSYLQSLDPQTNAKLEGYIQKIFSEAIRATQMQFPSAKHYKQSDFIAFMVPGRVEDSQRCSLKMEQIFQWLRRELADAVPFTITVGAGEYYSNITNIHKSYAEAKACISIGYQTSHFDCLLFFKSLGVYRLLNSLSQNQESKEFCEKFIQPLVEHDQHNGAELLLTLDAIIQSGWNLKEAAQKLYIHYNSAKYRFQKICAILNLDLREHESQLAVEIAMRIYRMSKQNYLL